MEGEGTGLVGDDLWEDDENGMYNSKEMDRHEAWIEVDPEHNT